MSLNDIEWQSQLIESFSSKLEISQLDVTRPDANVELLGIKVLDIHAQEPIEEVRDETLEHGGGE